MRAHLHFTAFLFAACGAALVALAFLAAPISNAASAAFAASADDDAALAAALVAWTGRSMAIGSAVLAGPTLLCAWGLVRRTGWSRWLGIFLGALAVVVVPIGTLVGGYVLWVLLSERFEPWFEARPAQDPADRRSKPR